MFIRGRLSGRLTRNKKIDHGKRVDFRIVIYPLSQETHEIKNTKRQETQYTTSMLYPYNKYSHQRNPDKVIHECCHYWKPGVLNAQELQWKSGCGSIE